MLGDGQCIEYLTKKQSIVIESVLDSKIDILFVSPERIETKGFQTLFSDERFPDINFVCIDEVHCLSEWSHNFRPGYIGMIDILNRLLTNPRYLALTATATTTTIETLAKHLNIEAKNVFNHPLTLNRIEPVIVHTPQSQKDACLLEILKNRNISTIVYVTYQKECERVAQLLCLNGINATAYHGGMDSQKRNQIQSQFKQKRFEILIATVAFGMGIDHEIDLIIQYGLPSSPEQYVQQIGRGGRQATAAKCYLLLNREDFIARRRISFQDGTELSNICSLFNSLKSKSGYFGISSSYLAKFDMKFKIGMIIFNAARLISPCFQFLGGIQKINQEIDGNITLYVSENSLEELKNTHAFFSYLTNSQIKSGGYVIDIVDVLCY
jgi:superfamily II DNA helicase RecQ